MSGGSYRGGSSIVGRRGFNSHDDAEYKSNKDDFTVLGDAEERRTRNVSEEKVLRYLITQWLNGKFRPRLHRHIAPKLREEIGDEPYDWMGRHKLFNEICDEIKQNSKPQKHKEINYEKEEKENLKYFIGHILENKRRMFRSLLVETIRSKELKEQIKKYGDPYVWAENHPLFKAISAELKSKISR